MKKAILILVMLLSVQFSFAQTFAEWFRQNKTQKKYLIEQIAALKVYAGFLKTGYDIGKKGLTTIGNIKNGDFSIHRDFFGALTMVNPAIRLYPRVADIITLQLRIMEIKHNTFRTLDKSEFTSDKERVYVRTVYNRLMDDCIHKLEELDNVALKSTLTLTDDQRLLRIDALFNSMSENYQFAKNFSNEVTSLAISREQQMREVATSRLLYGQ